MTILVIGVILWMAGHFLPSLAQGVRAKMIDAIGPGPYRGLFTLDAAIALVLIVVGYRSAEWVGVYDPPAWAVHANNTLMLIAVYLMGVGGAKGWLATKIRHPMLLGVALWAAAHLLANGDQASLILFGGMLIWAIVSMMLINRRDGAWVRPQPGGLRSEIMLIVVTLIIFGVITFAHGWLLGVNPFPG